MRRKRFHAISLIITMICIDCLIYSGNVVYGGSQPPNFLGLTFLEAGGKDRLIAGWEAATDDHTPAANITYEIHISQIRSFEPNKTTLYSTIIGKTQTVITGLAEGTTYYVLIIAVDADGNKSQERLYLSATTLKDTVTYGFPKVNIAYSNIYEIELSGSDGGSYTVKVKKTEEQIYPQSVRYTSENSLFPSYTMNISPEGTRAELQIDGSPRIWVLEIEGQSVKLKLKEGTSEEIELADFPIQDSTSQYTDLCGYGKAVCNKLNELDVSGKLATIAGVTASVGLIPIPGAQILEVPAGIFGAFATGFKCLDLVCLSFFGDDKQFIEAVSGFIPIKFLKPLQARFIKISRKFTQKLPVTDLGRKIRNRLTKYAADEFFGNIESFAQDKVGDLMSSLYKESNVQVCSGKQLLSDIKKTLKLDLCDKSSDKPSISITCNGSQSCEIDCDKTANLEVCYYNVKNDTKVHMTGPVYAGISFVSDIPAGSGLVNFTLTHVDAVAFTGCSGWSDTWIQVSVDSVGLYWFNGITLGNCPYSFGLPCYFTIDKAKTAPQPVSSSGGEEGVDTTQCFISTVIVGK